MKPYLLFEPVGLDVHHNKYADGEDAVTLQLRMPTESINALMDGDDGLEDYAPFVSASSGGNPKTRTKLFLFASLGPEHAELLANYVRLMGVQPIYYQ